MFVYVGQQDAQAHSHSKRLLWACLAIRERMVWRTPGLDGSPAAPGPDYHKRESVGRRFTCHVL